MPMGYLDIFLSAIIIPTPPHLSTPENAPPHQNFFGLDIAVFVCYSLYTILIMVTATG